MDFLHNFTVTVLLVTFLCFFCEALVYEGALGKYTSLITGLVISLSIVSAFLQVKDVDFSAMEIPQADYTAQETAAQDETVAAQFALDLETAVEASVFEKFGVEVQAKASVSAADGVLTVEGLTIENTRIDKTALSDFIYSQYGIKPEGGETWRN